MNKPAAALPLVIDEPVRHALNTGAPVVALESTVIAHGLPWPRNLEIGQAMEEEVRRQGAVPATIALLDGQLRIGLGQRDLERVASTPMPKASRRDLASLMATGQSAATTVAGTLVAMRAAGLSVLATGGIGGIHRGLEASLDISADLIELTRARAVVVCAGPKTILDLPRTVEALETLGIPLLGFQCDEVPGFYVRTTGLPVVARMESVQQTARTALLHWQLPDGAGLVLAVPVPEAAALPESLVGQVIEQALANAAAQHIRGAALTPFVLQSLATVTGGRTVDTNIALLLNNARVGAQLAVSLTKEEGT